LLLTPSDEVWQLVDEVHKLTGTPKAAIVSEILDEVAPVFLNQIEALRVLQESPREAQRLVQNFANESVGKLAQASLDLDAAIDGRTVQGQRARRNEEFPRPFTPEELKQQRARRKGAKDGTP
jgi:hypothetical protein